MDENLRKFIKHLVYSIPLLWLYGLYIYMQKNDGKIHAPIPWKMDLALRWKSAETNEPSPPLKIPHKLHFGAGTAAFLVEGALRTNGRRESYLEKYVLSNRTSAGRIHLPEISSDSYHQYKQDVQVAKDIGLKFYRFSLSWTRILPDGYAHNINEEGIEYYSALLDELEKAGIEPMIQLNHFDHPAVFEDFGGWQNASMVELFKDYANVVFQKFAHRVRYFLTFNEPNVLCHMLDSFVVTPNNMQSVFPRRYICSLNVLKAHAEVYHLYHQKYNLNRKGKISINFQCNDFISRKANDQEAADIAFAFGCDWFAHPIFSESGGYSNLFLRQIDEFVELNGYQTGIPCFSEYWIKRIRGTADFFSLSFFSVLEVISAPDNTPLEWRNFFIPPEAQLIVGFVDSDNGNYISKGLRSVLNKITEKYPNPPIYIVENGYFDGGELDDIERMKFIYDHVKEIIAAISEDHCNVRGYFYWTLIDGYELWNNHQLCYGLAHVDFNSPNRTRTLKKSAEWLRDVLAGRRLFLDV